MYIHNMDEASTGISGRIQKFVDTLRWYDEELCDHLLQQVPAPLPPLLPHLMPVLRELSPPSILSDG
jgi:hypothetical protein